MLLYIKGLYKHFIFSFLRSYSWCAYTFPYREKNVYLYCGIYFDDIEVKQPSGNNLDSLFIWMPSQQEREFGNYHSKITNNKTNLIEKEFRTGSN